MGDDGAAAVSPNLLVERLLRVIDEGRRTATYKLALLAGLIDAVALRPGSSTIPTREIAERVLALYYPQTRVYVAHDGIARELRQISMKSSPALRAVLRLRVAGDAASCRSVDDVRVQAPALYAEVLDEVETTFVRYPIPLLQVVGTTVVPFLYEVDWPEGTPVRQLRSEGRDEVRLLPGVADRLVTLGPLLRPLIELHWTRDVARLSGVSLEDDALHGHLFGSARVSFPAAIVTTLREAQSGECFYCGDRIAGRGQVDHFVAWSRWPNDAIENLVLADRCNTLKRDHLAAADHAERWVGHVKTNVDFLASAALKARWVSAPDRSLALARSTYGHVAPGTPLWRHGVTFDLATGPITL